MIKLSIIDENNLGLIKKEVICDDNYPISQVVTSFNWSPTVFIDRKRTKQNAIKTDLLVLDIDSGCSIDEAKQIFKEYEYLIGITKSHQKDKNGVICDRFRIVLWLEGSITSPDDYSATYQYAMNLCPTIDPSCKDISRFFYPCIDIVAINEGHTFPIIKSHKKLQLVYKPIETHIKGMLSKSTLDLLCNGAVPGTRHNRAVKAIFDLREQGYSLEEVMKEFETLSLKVNDPEMFGKHIQNQILDIFKRDIKLPRREREEDIPTFIRASDLLTDSINYLSNKDLVTGEPSGVEGLDKMLGGGFRLGELTVLMAQAKTGKNSLYHYLIHSMLERGIKIGYASRELDPAKEVIPNLLSINLNESAWKANISPEFINSANVCLSKWDLFFAPGYGFFDVSELKEWVESLVILGIQHFWLDHFHYMLNDEDQKNVSKLIKEIKTLAKQFNIHINLIVQPKYIDEHQRLSMNSLKGGSSINQALDNLLIMEKVQGERNLTSLRLEVARHKLAIPGEIFLRYDQITTKFSEEIQIFSEPEIIQNPVSYPI